MDDTPNFYKHGVFDRRYGGDLQGIIDKLGYLQQLGINAIYLNPIFYAPSLHKYDGSALHHVDPYFGPDPKGDLALIATENEHPETWHWTAADRLFLRLVKEAHQRGFHVLLDGVFNHTGRGFFAFRDLQEKQQASAYTGWYQVKTWAILRSREASLRTRVGSASTHCPFSRPRPTGKIWRQPRNNTSST